jgi:preprotein translocase subunit SecF
MLKMFPIRFLTTVPKIDFSGNRRPGFLLSILLILASVGGYFLIGLNYGIDFKGGILLEVRTSGPADLAAMRTKVGNLGLGDVSLQGFGGGSEVLIRVAQQKGDEREQVRAINKIKDALGTQVEYRRQEFVGPQVGEELIRAGIYATVFAILGITIYVWFRFEWQFGVGAVVSTLHDVVATVGFFAVTGMEFNLTSIAAILTVAGYSINDTVVVYDRVRDNLRKYKAMPVAELLNLSLNETLSRTINTGGTSLLALFALYLFGGDVIEGFSLAMIWGIVVGTYSSLFVASPLLLYMDIRRGLMGGSGRDSDSKTAASSKAG